ncbi:TolC family protein [Lyticum sinuosum]|uniref:TolC superfamily protein n=1 Tax=Lyticum sinuosum TaxID=1332059 RepID=A0AAE4VK54_9RICK|nr:TolC family protein [Lyticum sinuosum]MDZ5761277.1 TolC superfamily protein [Lyticum sinuosum]
MNFNKKIKLLKISLLSSLIIISSGCNRDLNYKRPSFDLPENNTSIKNNNLSDKSIVNSLNNNIFQIIYSNTNYQFKNNNSYNNENDYNNHKINHTLYLDNSWWKYFYDKNLNYLINYSLENNYDLLNAKYNLDQAKLIAKIQEKSLLPSLNVDAILSRGTNKAYDEILNNSSIDFSLNYQLDVWGKLNAVSKSKQAKMMQTAEVKETVKLTVITSIINSYFDLYRDQNILQYQLYNLIIQEKLKDLVEKSVNIGKIDISYLNTSEKLISEAEIRLQNANNQLCNTRNKLLTLLSLSPKTLVIEINYNKDITLDDISHLILNNKKKWIIFDLPNEIPTNLLEQRPDIKAAEYDLISAHADILKARAEFFPDINISTTIGLTNDKFSEIFNNMHRQWGIASSLVGNIFNFGKNIDILQLSKLEKEKKLVQYQKTVIIAFAELSNSLNMYNNAKKSFLNAKNYYELQLENAKLQEIRYNTGSIPLQDYLKELQTTISALSKAESAYNDLNYSLILVIKSIGIKTQ